jgi:hypothetical protein
MDLQSRYSAIQQKEEDLRRREASLRTQNVTVDVSNTPNFPPCYPLMYHNLAEEIPISMQWFLRIALCAIIGLLVTAVVNLISCFTSGSFTSDSKASDVVENVVFGAIIGLLTGPLAFRVTYMREYSQCKASDISLTTLALQGLLFAWIALCAIGLHGMGTVGVIMTIDAVGGGGGAFVSAMAVISCVLWVGIACVEVFLLGRLLLLYKGSGQKVNAVNTAYAPAPIE